MPTQWVVSEKKELGYPEELLCLRDAPERLFIQGELPQGKALAIVGSRSADRRGLKLAYEIASELGRAGVTVVSGGAQGIDQAAHRGALDGGGKTIMVLGCGFEVDYPAGSGDLRAEVSSSGAVVSELEPSAKPWPAHFPRRNRLIAALSEAVVVVQAGQRSGSLVTAQWARELDRMVLAVPGIPQSVLARGTHELLRSGALLVECAADVLKALGLEDRSHEREARVHEKAELKGIKARIANCLDGGPASPDDVALALNKPMSEILATLVQLEIDGEVVSYGGCYERK